MGFRLARHFSPTAIIIVVDLVAKQRIKTSSSLKQKEREGERMEAQGGGGGIEAGVRVPTLVTATAHADNKAEHWLGYVDWPYAGPPRDAHVC